MILFVLSDILALSIADNFSKLLDSALDSSPSEAKKDVFPRKIVHNGYSYELKDYYRTKKDNKLTGNYRCPFWREAKTGGHSHGSCKATLQVKQEFDGSLTISVR